MRISDWSSDVCSSDLKDACKRGIDGISCSQNLGDMRKAAQECGSRQWWRIPNCTVRDSARNGSNTMGGDTMNNVIRSEERRGGKECVSTCRSGWSPYH